MTLLNTNKDPIKKSNKNLILFLKFFIPIITMISILGSTISIIAYNDQKNNIINDKIKSTQIIASVASSTLVGDDIAQIKSAEDMSKVVYTKILTQFRMLNQDKQLKDIYTIYFEDNNLYYGVVSTEKDTLLTGNKIKHLSSSYPDIKHLKEGHIFSDNTIKYNDFKEPIISSFAPIFNKNDEFVGAIACDYDASSIIKNLHILSNKLISITIFSVFLSIIILSVIILLIIKNLHTINKKIESLTTSNGDLTTEIHINSKDELSHFSIHLNKFIQYIRKLFINIKSHLKTIENNISKAYTGINDADNNIIENDANIKEINNSVYDITFTIDNIDSASNEILDSISSSNLNLGDGLNYAQSIKEHAQKTAENAILKQTIATKRVTLLSNTLSEKLKTTKSVSKINDLAKNIIAITDETNLLALNASIKAAKAGLQGKGFYVIANELSQLAVTTEITAKEIDDASTFIITTIQSLANAITELLYFIDELSINVFSDLVKNSELYLRNSDQLTSILEHFSDFTSILTQQLNEVQTNISNMKNNVHTSNSNIEYITNISKDLAMRTNQIKEDLNLTKEIGTTLNKEFDKFKL